MALTRVTANKMTAKCQLCSHNDTIATMRFLQPDGQPSYLVCVDAGQCIQRYSTPLTPSQLTRLQFILAYLKDK